MPHYQAPWAQSSFSKKKRKMYWLQGLCVIIKGNNLKYFKFSFKTHELDNK